MLQTPYLISLMLLPAFSPIIDAGQHERQTQHQVSTQAIRYVSGKAPYVVVTFDNGIHRTFNDSQLGKTGKESINTPYGLVSAHCSVSAGDEDGHPLPPGIMSDSAYYDIILATTIESPKGLPIIVKVIFPGSTWLHVNGERTSEVSSAATDRYCEVRLLGGVNSVSMGSADHE